MGIWAGCPDTTYTWTKVSDLAPSSNQAASFWSSVDASALDAVEIGQPLAALHWAYAAVRTPAARLSGQPVPPSGTGRFADIADIAHIVDPIR